MEFYAALGNHDIRRGTKLQLNYPKWNMNGRHFYSFTKGDGLVEFFALDSTALSGEAKSLVILEKARLDRQKAELERKQPLPDQEKRELEKINAELSEDVEFTLTNRRPSITSNSSGLTMRCRHPRRVGRWSFCTTQSIPPPPNLAVTVDRGRC